MTLLVTTLLFLTAVTAPAEELTQLRGAVAERFFELEPHLALAKHHLERGNRLLAFYIVEDARRTKAEQQEFGAAFRRLFIDREPFDNSAEAERELLARLAEESTNGEILTKLGDVYGSRAEWTNAAVYLRTALELSPGDFTVRAALAEVMRRSGQDQAADDLIEEYRKTYPRTVESFRMRVTEALENPSESTESLLDEALALFPNDGELLFDQGIAQQRRGDNVAAKASFVLAAKRASDSSLIQSWVGRYFLKVVNDREASLGYYLNAYFRDPHAYDSEYAESRIRSLNWELGHERFAELMAKGSEGIGASLRDANPIVTLAALDDLAKSWDPAHVAAVAVLLGHDDVVVRWRAMTLIRDNVAPVVVDSLLPTLLGSSDPRVRGLAAYLLVARQGEAALGALSEMLGSELQLVRFDAISALAMSGGPRGRDLARSRLKLEKCPALVSLLEGLEDGPSE